MTGPYAYNSSILPSLLILLLVIALTVYAWRQRRRYGALQFVVAGLLTTLWVGGSVAEHAAMDLAAKVFWYKFQVAWQIPVVTAIACFVLEYTWPGRWLTRRNLALLCIPPLLMVALIVTNDLHNMMWLSLASEGSIVPVRGPGNWPFVIYATGLGLIQFSALVWLFLRSPSHRWPTTIMLLTVIANRTAYLFMATNRTAAHLRPEVLLVGVSSLMFAVALFGFRILDPIAQAQRTTIAQMRDGMLVLDPEGRVASMNPAAQAILGVSAKNTLGQVVQSLLPAEADMGEGLREAGSGRAVICVGAGPSTRHVVLAASDLKDWRGLTTGRLLMLRDVTVERQAQAQIVQQQRSLATLEERDRLARELHDSLGQTLAAAHLQASTTRMLLDQRKLAEADECLADLADMALAAEVDVREYILGARLLLSTGPGFFEGLREYIARFGRLFGIKAEVEVPAGLGQRGLDPSVATQLLRIVQESLSNVRKHARAANATVAFSVSGSQLQVVISDDGQGFDPGAVAAPHGAGFGMQTMRERAESLGGSVEVSSQPGQGTRVAVQVPLEELSDDVGLD